MNRRGFTLIELLIVIAIIGILAAIAVPSFMSMRTRARNADAENMGRSCALSEEIYFQNTGGRLSGSYTATLSKLLLLNPELTKDSNMHYQFSSANVEGYTFTVWHEYGDEQYVYTQQSY